MQERGTAPIVGSFDKGGMVPQTGIAKVHAGEQVIPEHLVKHIHSLPFVGSFQRGGVIPATGKALLHEGELVVPPRMPARRPPMAHAVPTQAVTRSAVPEFAAMHLTLKRIEQVLMKRQTPVMRNLQAAAHAPTPSLNIVQRGTAAMASGQNSQPSMNLQVTFNVPPGSMTRQQATEHAEAIWKVLENKARLRQIPLKLEPR